jgi:hypothetical protein
MILHQVPCIKCGIMIDFSRIEWSMGFMNRFKHKRKDCKSCGRENFLSQRVFKIEFLNKEPQKWQ